MTVLTQFALVLLGIATKIALNAQFIWIISLTELSVFLRLYPQAINVVVFHDP